MVTPLRGGLRAAPDRHHLTTKPIRRNQDYGNTTGSKAGNSAMPIDRNPDQNQNDAAQQTHRWIEAKSRFCDYDNMCPSLLGNTLFLQMGDTPRTIRSCLARYCGTVSWALADNEITAHRDAGCGASLEFVIGDRQELR
ncbi:UNVERIFIED_ORG: hypothetical protein ABIB52_004251 [Arthrobacter sp. UYCu721]